MKKFILPVLLFFILRTNVHALDFEKLFFTPGISVGYTFGAGTNWGFMFDTGIADHIQNHTIRYGLSFSWYYISVQSNATRHYTHRIRSLFSTIMFQNDFMDVKLGFGRVKNPWGIGNRCIVHGTNADISFAYPNLYSPWIGFKTFRYKFADWAWFSKPYNSIYIKYKYDAIQNTGLKNL